MKVFDHVFTPAACAVLHAAACSRGLGHALFSREQPHSAIETALASFLDEVGDGASHIEYWSRQDWKHIEAHADVDENRAAEAPGQELRYPRTGHVLYLEVGPRVHGPTCIWEPDKAAGTEFGALTTVPAVAGRVLRFDGRLQHAVPRPADVWLAPFTISQSGSADDFVRSVVLFNTWDDAPPLDVEREAAPDVEAPSDLVLARCAPRAEWSDVAPRVQDTGGDLGSMKIWLLGDEHRRGRLERTLSLPVDRSAVAEALEQTSAVTHLAAPAASSSVSAAEKAPPAAAASTSRAMALAAALRKAS